MPETSDRVKVLYICGTRRCGSTMLSRLLGEVDGFVNVGEMASYFLRQKLAGPCGCGAPVDDCPFWRSFPLSPVAQALGRKLIRVRHLPRMLLASPARSHDTQDFLLHATQLYRAVRRQTGASVIVDSSKSPAMALVLAQSSGLEVSVVHLVRHPIGVVASRRRAKAYLQAASVSQVLLEWWAYNLAAELLHGRVRRSWRLHYEDLVRAPRPWVEGISSAVAETSLDCGGLGCRGLDYRGLGCPDLDCSFIAGHRAKVGVQHILGGNPDKLAGPDIHIQPRPATLPARIAAPVYLLAAPLLLRYGLGRRAEKLASQSGLVRAAGESNAVELR